MSSALSDIATNVQRPMLNVQYRIQILCSVISAACTPWRVIRGLRKFGNNERFLDFARNDKGQAKKRSGESMGCGLQMRATQCSQLSWPLRISISTRRK